MLKLEENLRAKGFMNDTSDGAPICRWLFKNVKVDVMPTDENILGFSNIWYIEGINNKVVKTLPDETEIFVFPLEYYLAAKFEAHKNHSGHDLRQSHDFEDIIYIFDNCPDLLEIIGNTKANVKAYLKNECQNLLNNNNLTEGIESALSYGSGNERTEIIENLISKIIEVE